MKIDKATELQFAISSQREMLKKCREIMRNKGIGELYPSNVENYRTELRAFAKATSEELSDDFKTLFPSITPELLIEFISEQGIVPKELERFLRKKDEAR